MQSITKAGLAPGLTASSRFHDTLHWLSTWTSYFFVLSGFVLTMAKMTSKDDKTTIRFVLERLTTTYPAYALSLALVLLVTGPDLWLLTRSDWHSLGWHLGLLQAWVPPDSARGRYLPGKAMVWNGPAWFMSALLFYWILFKPLYYMTQRAPRLWVGPLALICWLMAGLAWCDSRLFGHAVARGLMPRSWPHDDPKAWADVYHYNPLFSLNNFVAGMLLARLLLDAEKDEEDGGRRPLWRKITAHGTDLAYAGFALVLATLQMPPTLRYNNNKPVEVGGLFSFIHNGGCLPVHGLLILGLCTEEDVCSRLFQRHAFSWWGAMSYEQYVLQTAVFKLLGDIYVAVSHGPYHRPYDGLAWQLAMPLAVTFAAFFVHHFVSVPIASALRQYLKASNPIDSIRKSALYGAILDTATSRRKSDDHDPDDDDDDGVSCSRISLCGMSTAV